MQHQSTIDRKFVTWHIIYTAILTVWSIQLWNTQELGIESAYYVLGLGAVPSFGLLILGLTRPMAAYRAAMVHGGIVVLIGIILAAVSYGFLWLVVFFPVLASVLEALYLHWRWSALKKHFKH